MEEKDRSWMGDWVGDSALDFVYTSLSQQGQILAKAAGRQEDPDVSSTVEAEDGEEKGRSGDDE